MNIWVRELCSKCNVIWASVQLNNNKQAINSVVFSIVTYIVVLEWIHY